AEKEPRSSRDIPGGVAVIVLVTDLVIAVAVWRILSSAAARSGLASRAQRTIRAGSAVFLGLWLAAALLAGPVLGALFPRAQPSIPPGVLLSAATLPIAPIPLWRPTHLPRALRSAPCPALIGVQLCRTIGLVFLILLALDRLPAHFALPAGWGDIAVGLAAPLVALSLARGAAGVWALAVAWNVLGLLDLVVAVGMGSGLLVPVLAPHLGHVPPAAALRAFPMILVPAFAVPVSVLLH